MRDVTPAEMWEAINSTTLHLRHSRRRRELPKGGCAGGAYQASQHVKQRTALIWASRRARDAARRGEALSSGGRADRGLPTWCCGCCASRWPGGRIRLAPGDESARADGNALVLLQAVGGFHAYLRAVTAPPNAQSGRALPAVRARLPGQRRRLRSTRCTRRSLAADASPARVEAGAAREPPRRPTWSSSRRALPRRRRADRHLRAHPAGARCGSSGDVADRLLRRRGRRRARNRARGRLTTTPGDVTVHFSIAT